MLAWDEPYACHFVGGCIGRVNCFIGDFLSPCGSVPQAWRVQSSSVLMCARHLTLRYLSITKLVQVGFIAFTVAVFTSNYTSSIQVLGGQTSYRYWQLQPTTAATGLLVSN